MSRSPLKVYRGRFPFRLSTTSYILPDRILPNVLFLGPSFDEIELVLFESDGEHNLPDEEEIERLKHLSTQYGLSFNVHLPIDLYLGDRHEEVRAKGISVLKKFIGRTLPLHPSTYTLHLSLRDRDGRDEEDIPSWRRRLIQSLERIGEWGIPSKQVSIETLDYPFEWIEEIVSDFGFSVCLDLGHILLYEQDLKQYMEKYLFQTSIIHFHGFRNGRDHLGIDHLEEGAVDLILSHLKDYKGILSIEVFSLEDLSSSLKVLEERWNRRE